MKKVVFFPYHPDVEVLIEYRDQFKEYEYCGLISYAEDSKDVEILNNKIGLTNITDESLLNMCDAIVVLDNYRGFKLDKYYKVIQEAFLRKKEVLLTPLAASQLDLTKLPERTIYLELLPKISGLSDENYFIQKQSENLRLYDVDIPVIAVFGHGKFCGKFENQILFNMYASSEYSVATVCSNSLGALFGYYTLPSALFRETIAFADKVIMLNHYIERVLKDNNYDLMQLGVPEGIVPFGKKEFHHFSEYPLVLSKAIKIDLAMLCVYFLYGDRVEKSINEMAKKCEHSFAIPVVSTTISRAMFNIPQSTIDKISYERLGDEFLDRYYPKTKDYVFPVIDLHRKNNYESVFNKIIEMLKNNTYAI